MAIRVDIGRGQAVELSEPRRDQFAGNLGGAVEFSLAHVLYKIMEVMGAGLGIFGGSMIVRFLEQLEPELVEYVAPLLDQVLGIPDLPEGFRRFIEKIRHPESPAAAAILGQLGGVAGGTVVSSVLGSLLAPVTYAINNQIRPARTGPGEGYAMLWRGHLGEATLLDWLRDQGWPEPAVSGFADILRPRLGEGDLINLMWRGDLGEGQVRDELAKRGYPGSEIDGTLRLAQRIPGPADLISMAVREAFHPDLIRKYRYMDNFPPEFATWMEKQGYDRAWAEKYWVAHWRLPSIQMAFEMLHRQIINEDAVRDLLRTADVAPIWHQHIIDISYAPYTRVDTRRMHKLGVLEDADLIKAYRDQGYDLERATNMARFTILYNTETEREGSKGDVLKGYRLGMFGAADCLAMLVEIGVSEEWGQYYIAVEDIRREEEYIEEEVTTIRELYTTGEITRTKAHERLNSLNLAARRTALYLEKWDVIRERKTKRPTRSDLERWVKEDIIDVDTYGAEMIKRGYLPDYTTNYTLDLAIRMHREAQEEEERARKEQERVRLAEIKTVYDEKRADLDVEIAALRVRKAENKVLLFDCEDDECVAALKEANAKLEVDIRELAQQKARAKVEFLGA